MDQVASLEYVEETTLLQALSTKIFMHPTKKEPLDITYAQRKMCPLSSKERKLQNSNHAKMRESKPLYRFQLNSSQQ
jgi:hypothetical protein